MQKEMMTLSAALATGRPFKRNDFNVWSDEKDFTYTHNIYDKSVYELIWEIKPEEKPPMRVWTNNKYEILITSEDPTQWNDGFEWKDISETLAKALAPYLRGEG